MKRCINSLKSKKPQAIANLRFLHFNKTLMVPYSHMGNPHTTIGVTAFHFWVRNGIRWDHSTMAIRKILDDSLIVCSLLGQIWLPLRILISKQAVLSVFFCLFCLVSFSLLFSFLTLTFLLKNAWGCMVKPLGQLVRVSSMYHYTYTPRLSTS